MQLSSLALTRPSTRSQVLGAWRPVPGRPFASVKTAVLHPCAPSTGRRHAGGSHQREMAQACCSCGPEAEDVPGTSCRPDACELLRSLKSAASVRELQMLVSLAGASMGRSELQATLVRLAKLMQQSRKAQVKRFLQQLRTMVQSGPGQHPVHMPAPIGEPSTRVSLHSSMQSASDVEEFKLGQDVRAGSATGGASQLRTTSLQLNICLPRDQQSEQAGSDPPWSLMPAAEQRAAQDMLAELLPLAQAAWGSSPTAQDVAHYVLALGCAAPSSSLVGAPQDIPDGRGSSSQSSASASSWAGHLDVLLERAQPHLADFPPDCLAKLLWGLGAAGYKPEAGWLQVSVVTGCQAGSREWG